MKQFKFKTDKGDFLLVDEDSEGKVNLPQGVEYSEIGRLRTLTEEQASEIVDNFELYGGVNVGYKNYENEEPTLDTAIESLHSLIKSKGIFLFENPFNIENCFEMNYYIKRLESVQKTFYNPYIFKINVGSSKNNS